MASHPVEKYQNVSNIYFLNEKSGRHFSTVLAFSRLPEASFSSSCTVPTKNKRCKPDTQKISKPENGAKFLLNLFLFKLKTMSVPNIEENVPSDVGYLCLSTFQAGVKPGEEEQKFELFLFFLCCL